MRLPWQARRAQVLGSITLKEPDVPDATTKKEPFYTLAVFWVTVLLMAPIDWVVYKVMDDVTQPNHDIRLVVVTAVISGALGAVYGFWLASSYSSAKKDDTIAAAVPKAPDAPK